MSSETPLATLYRQTRPRRESPLSTMRSRRSSPALDDRPALPATLTMDDSDDDNDNGKVPQLSALAQMLLNDGPGGDAGPAPRAASTSPPLSRFAPRKRLSPPLSPEGYDAAPGVMAAPRNPSREASPDYMIAQELVTPAPGRHGRRVFSGQYSMGPTVGSSGSSGGSADMDKGNDPSRYTSTVGQGSVARPGPPIGVHASTTASAMRWKRVGRGLMGGLAGAPRRGPRRESDQTREEGREDNDGYEKNSPIDEPQRDQDQEDDDYIIVKSRGGSSSNTPADQPERPSSAEQPLTSIGRHSRRASPDSFAHHANKMQVYHSSTPDNVKDGPKLDQRLSGAGSNESLKRLNFMARSRSGVAAITSGASRPSSAEDLREKENMMPPPTFKRPTASFQRLSSDLDKQDEDSSPKEKAPYKTLVPSPIRVSPEKRKVLTLRNSNTPLRPAPPPPKMNMLQAATATAGAAKTSSSQQSRRSRSTVHINGTAFRRLDAIGKGGSSKVYKVMAENFKIFAMKKVTFTDQDGPSAIAGYKGEIDLLNKLKGEDRVIRLYDHELNNEKQTLTMLMECGETDLAKILTLRNSNDDSIFDVSFTRYYWREMLQCVETVHRHNIIHSDLKPANFLLVSGRLKLIDFGIANAIQDDTVNVHRESQVGTLNYMSPEAIVDINASSGRPMASIGAPRLMKLGAPSDVWSLGCILYQMTYGTTPFAHLTNIYNKIAAIPDESHIIEFRERGIGGVPVPRSLIATMKACLERDKTKRPTIAELLSDDDPFLNPDKPREMVEISQEMIKRLLENTANQMEKTGKPDDGTISAWAEDVYRKLGRLREQGAPWAQRVSRQQ